MTVLSFLPFLLLTFALVTLCNGSEDYLAKYLRRFCQTLSLHYYGIPQYAVTASQLTDPPDAKLKVMLTSTTGIPIRGFVMQARKSEDSDSAFGKFFDVPSYNEYVTCGSIQNVSILMFL